METRGNSAIQPRTTRGPVAIVGAGIAGLTCARRLIEAGRTVQLFDKSRGVGGRMATRRGPDGAAFDHGAQYFTVRDARFESLVATLQARGIVAPWPARVVELSHGRATPQEAGPSRYVGVPGMSAVGKFLAEGLPVALTAEVGALARRDSGWELRTRDGAALGTFAEVALSAPAPQTAVLLKVAPELQATINSVVMRGCWAALLAFADPCETPYDAAFVADSPLSWIACNSSKPGRAQSPTTWILHAHPDWSDARLERTPEVVLPELLAAFWSATGLRRRSPSFAAAHRWRYALPAQPLPQACLYDAARGLGACGDWCGGPRVEGAYLSGLTLAEAMLAD
jgi:renalase